MFLYIVAPSSKLDNKIASIKELRGALPVDLRTAKAIVEDAADGYYIFDVKEPFSASLLSSRLRDIGYSVVEGNSFRDVIHCAFRYSCHA